MFRINFMPRLFVTVFMVSIFVACEKENKQDNQITEETSQVASAPFFCLAKGDTISKDVIREKPLFSANEQSTILFSTVNRLKTTGVSSGDGPIRNLYVSIRRDNSVGTWLWDGLTKIPVDLNEGAGGKWIYLFYSKTSNTDAINSLQVLTGRDTPDDYCPLHPGSWVVKKENGDGADLNDGAGGMYVWLVANRNETTNGSLLAPIQNIMIVSTTDPTVTYTGWNKIAVDLNKGAGGKWIFLFYQR